MAHFLKCPACGHKHRASNDRVGKKLMCSKCNEVFPFSPTPATAAPSSPPEGPGATLGLQFVKKAMGDPSAALDGALPGAASGLLAGIFGALVVGLVRGESVGEIVAKILLGFVVGFGMGTFLGAILGAYGRRHRPDLRIEPGRALLAGGAVIGSLVVALVENFRWIPVGAGLGAIGAVLWTWLCNRLEAAVHAPERLKADESFPNDDLEETNGRWFERPNSRYPGN
jgi:hypothetical protein